MNITAWKEGLQVQRLGAVSRKWHSMRTATTWDPQASLQKPNYYSILANLKQAFGFGSFGCSSPTCGDDSSLLANLHDER